MLNPKIARSQLMGGMLWGLSQALLEGNRMDPRTGRWASASLGDYLVPVNADAPDVDVELIEVDDQVTGPLGVKGVGEIGQVGAAAAIANAVFHATGRRVRELPIAIEHLLAHLQRARRSLRAVARPRSASARGAALARGGWAAAGLGRLLRPRTRHRQRPEALLVLGPLSRFGLAGVAMIAFWWNDWPGSRLTAPWTGLIDSLLVAAAAVVLTIAGQAVVERADLSAESSKPAPDRACPQHFRLPWPWPGPPSPPCSSFRWSASAGH